MPETMFPQSGGGISTPVSVANGGTGATTASAARANLGAQAAGSYAASSHTHAATAIVSGTLDASRLPATVTLLGNSLNREGGPIQLDVLPAAVQAQGTITLTGVPNDSESFVIGGGTFVWKTSPGAWNEVQIGGDAVSCAANLVTTLTGGLAGFTYTDNLDGTVTVTNDEYGDIPVTFTEACTNMTMDGGGLLGGTTAGVSAVLPALDGSRLRSIAASQVSGLGSAATLDVGTGANDIVQLDGSSKLPAVDGSALLNLPASGGETVNIETLAGDKTLVAGTDATFQFLSSGGAARNITLQTSPTPPTGSTFTIRHMTASTYDLLTIKSGATTIDKIGARGMRKFIFDGTDWTGAWIGSGSTTAYYSDSSIYIGQEAQGNGGTGIAIGGNAITRDGNICFGAGSAWAYGTNVAVFGYGARSNAGTSPVVLGHSANNFGSDSVVIGHSATNGGGGGNISIGTSVYNYSDSINIGYNAYGGTNAHAISIGPYSRNDNEHTIALGYYANATRYGEVAFTSDGSSSKKNKHDILSTIATTTNATPTEAFLFGVASNRIGVVANSAFKFTMDAVAYSNANTEGAVWTIKGGIRRDGANNTTLIGTVAKTMDSNDAGAAAWDITVTADDTNEALKIEVTGAESRTIHWNIRTVLTEVLY